MRLGSCVFVLCLIEGLGLSQCLVSDGACFLERSAALLEEAAKDADPAFLEALERVKDSPFTLAVRYCLGRDGDASSRGFVECVASLSSCPLPWHSIVNWQLCLCGTLHCVLKGCFHHWLATSDFANTKCFAHCGKDAFACLLRQAEKIPLGLAQLPRGWNV